MAKVITDSAHLMSNLTYMKLVNSKWVIPDSGPSMPQETRERLETQTPVERMREYMSLKQAQDDPEIREKLAKRRAREKLRGQIQSWPLDQVLERLGDKAWCIRNSVKVRTSQNFKGHTYFIILFDEDDLFENLQGEDCWHTFSQDLRYSLLVTD